MALIHLSPGDTTRQLPHRAAGLPSHHSRLYTPITMPNPSSQDLLQSALAHHRAGLLAMQSSRPDLAAAYLARAALVAPNVAVYQHNLAEAWMLAGDLNQAVACLRRAAQL